MRILSLTAGAASMYCGSCLRDNALAAELIRQGHDVTLLPFYTPTLTDEENVSRQQQVFFGGISVYLEQHMPWYRRGRRLLEVVVDAPRGDQGIHERIDRRRSEAARRDDRLDAARGRRQPAQRNRQADRVRDVRMRLRT